MEIDSLRDLYLAGLAELLYAEECQSSVLPELTGAIRDESLREKTKGYQATVAERPAYLERILKSDSKGQSGSCGPVDELLCRAREIGGSEEMEPELRDAALLAALQSLLHWKLSRIGSLRAYAEDFGEHDVADWLAAAAEEEGALDRELSRLAERTVNFKAADL